MIGLKHCRVLSYFNVIYNLIDNFLLGRSINQLNTQSMNQLLRHYSGVCKLMKHAAEKDRLFASVPKRRRKKLAL